MSARMELHVALSMRLDAIVAHRLANAYRAEVLREAVNKLDEKILAIAVGSGPPEQQPDGRVSGLCEAVGILRRMAEGAGQAGKDTPTGESTQPTELTATLHVDRSESRCGNCSEPTLVTGVTRHTDISGWTPRPGGGCGARFTAIAAANNAVTPDLLREMRPDLPMHDQKSGARNTASSGESTQPDPVSTALHWPLGTDGTATVNNQSISGHYVSCSVERAEEGGDLITMRLLVCRPGTCPDEADGADSFTATELHDMDQTDGFRLDAEDDARDTEDGAADA